MTSRRHNYRRKRAVTKITQRVVVRTVVGLHRRVKWRLRELSDEAGRPVSLRECLERIDAPMGADSTWHAITRSRIDVSTLDMLTEALRMDEVEGWERPWPKLPPKRERRSLADTVRAELTGESPGKD